MHIRVLSVFGILVWICLFSIHGYAQNLDWNRSGGTNASLKFSGLTQITPANIKNLELAWTYHSNNFSVVQINPVFINNTIITTARDGSVICLNAVNGKERWRTSLGIDVGRRGLLVYKEKLFVPSSNGTYVLKLEDGSIDKSFGKNGVFGKELSFLPPVVDGANLIVANLTSIESFNLVSGALNWSMKLEKDNQVARMWSGFSYDEKNKLIYVVTSNAGWFLDEDMKEGGYFNSLVAVDAISGKVRWAIKEIKHDLWDLDMVGPPMLADIKIDGKPISVVLAVSKSGNTIFANRLTGELIYQSGYKTLTDKNKYPPVTQLDIKRPTPFSSNFFDLDKDVTSLSQPKKESVLHKIRKAKQGDLLPVAPGYDVVMFGLHGGAEWSGGALDPNRNILIVPSNRYPWILRATYFDSSESSALEIAKKNNSYMEKCSQCHGENLRGWFQNELNGDIYVPSLINISPNIPKEKFTDLDAFKKIHSFSSYIKGEYVSPFHMGYLKSKRDSAAKRIEKYCKRFGLSVENTMAVKKLIMSRFQPELSSGDVNTQAMSGLQKVSSSDLGNIYQMLVEIDHDLKRDSRLAIEPVHQLLLDKDGMFGSEPPWGNLTAIDLNTGLIKWQVPFGEYLDPVSKKVIQGDMNFGGAITTKTGLIFASGTRDGYARAFNVNNGEELWRSAMPAAGSSPPMTYSAGGCQYVLFTATGGQFYGYTKSDTTLAYKLKGCQSH